MLYFKAIGFKQIQRAVLIAEKSDYVNYNTLFIHKCYYLYYAYECKVECLWKIGQL